MTTSTTAAPTSTGPALREGLREPKAGELIRYENPTAPGAERAWKNLNEIEDDVHWRRGALAHAISSKGVYGGDDLSGFARETGASYSTVRDYLATYRRVLALSPVARATVLKLAWPRYSHYRAANPVKGDRAYTELLTRADRDRWSVAKLAEEVSKLLGESRQEQLPEMPPLATESPRSKTTTGRAGTPSPASSDTSGSGTTSSLPAGTKRRAATAGPTARSGASSTSTSARPNLT